MAHIDGLPGSKSSVLADAQESGTHIIIVTIQTFPYSFDAISNRSVLKGRGFAIIVDEANGDLLVLAVAVQSGLTRLAGAD